MNSIKIAIFLLVFISTSSVARTDCPAAKVSHIQIEGNTVLYTQQGSNWRTLGTLNRQDGTEERYAALLAAQMSGKRVAIGYSSNSYDCNAANYTEVAFIVRIFND